MGKSMFKRDVQQLKDLILRNLRSQGLETPLLQKRLIDAWPTVMGDAIARYTQNLYIRNQTLFVHLTNPALRADLSMQRQEIVRKLNENVGSQVIADIRFN
jgi:predicted nucleic acid-binding Zn ribbon protein